MHSTRAACIIAAFVLTVSGETTMAAEPHNPVQPPVSEIFDAMAKGVMSPYLPPAGFTGKTWSSGPYDARAYEEAKSQANMYRALADLYRRYEQNTGK